MQGSGQVYTACLRIEQNEGGLQRSRSATQARGSHLGWLSSTRLPKACTRFPRSDRKAIDEKSKLGSAMQELQTAVATGW